MVALQARLVVPEEVADHWLRGLEDYRDGVGLMEDCLGFKARQGKKNESIPNMHRYHRRDNYIKAIANQAEGGPWPRAKQVAGWIKQFKEERSTEYSWREALYLHRGYPKLVWDLLATIFRQDVNVPDSPSQIYRILKKDKSFLARNPACVKVSTDLLLTRSWKTLDTDT